MQPEGVTLDSGVDSAEGCTSLPTEAPPHHNPAGLAQGTAQGEDCDTDRTKEGLLGPGALMAGCHPNQAPAAEALDTATLSQA